jgi:hypothetical protein
MRMVRLMKLRAHGDEYSTLLPERAITHGFMGATAAANWGYAHIRMTADELTDNIRNDEIHNVRHA